MDSGPSGDLELVFKIVNEESRATVANPALRALKEGLIVGLANHTLLIAKDGKERPIDDSAAPIRSDNGDVAGAVLVFRDVTERREQEQAIPHALEYAQGIVSTIRESLLVLHGDLRVKSANRTFYKTFQTSSRDTEGRFVYDIGGGRWNIRGSGRAGVARQYFARCTAPRGDCLLDRDCFAKDGILILRGLRPLHPRGPLPAATPNS